MTYVPPPIDCGLFHWRSTESDEIKTTITAWYRGLPPEQRDYVDTLRRERYDEGWDDGQDNEW